MEGTAATKTGERAIDAATMIEAFHRTADQHGDRVAIRTKDDEVTITWGELRDRVNALAGGLAGLGVQRGDTVALMFGNSFEFHLCDLAAMTLGATPV
jgi:acyl-CoA synthetase (AMP-forming)/AMP-acid ligase II